MLSENENVEDPFHVPDSLIWFVIFITCIIGSFIAYFFVIGAHKPLWYRLSMSACVGGILFLPMWLVWFSTADWIERRFRAKKEDSGSLECDVPESEDRKETAKGDGSPISPKDKKIFVSCPVCNEKLMVNSSGDRIWCMKCGGLFDYDPAYSGPEYGDSKISPREYHVTVYDQNDHIFVQFRLKKKSGKETEALLKSQFGQVLSEVTGLWPISFSDHSMYRYTIRRVCYVDGGNIENLVSRADWYRLVGEGKAKGEF